MQQKLFSDTPAYWGSEGSQIAVFNGVVIDNWADGKGRYKWQRLWSYFTHKQPDLITHYTAWERWSDRYSDMVWGLDSSRGQPPMGYIDCDIPLEGVELPAIAIINDRGVLFAIEIQRVEDCLGGPAYSTQPMKDCRIMGRPFSAHNKEIDYARETIGGCLRGVIRAHEQGNSSSRSPGGPRVKYVEHVEAFRHSQREARGHRGYSEELYRGEWGRSIDYGHSRPSGHGADSPRRSPQ